MHFFKEILKKLVPFIVPIVFFIIAIMTISDYGMNWDSPVHFARGQAFLRYFLTGKTDYKDLPARCMDKDNYVSVVDYKTGERCDRHKKNKVSPYQSTILDFNFFKKDIYGHPPLSDIFTAVTNQIFFIKLGWLEDLDAYHLYNILATFFLALTVCLWVNKTFGSFASIIAGLVVYLFPLLLGEQHFNVKDPPMAAFFTIALYFFWLALVKKKALYMLLSAIAGGISFSTKFNFIFAPFILLPWILVYLGTSFYSQIFRKTGFNFGKIIKLSWQRIPKKLLMVIFFYPLIVFAIFFFSWPVLWPDPINNVSLVFKFYRDIGITSCPYTLFSPLWIQACPNYMTVTYFLITLPLVTLFFFIIGFFMAIINIKKYNYVTALWLSFLILTIARVTVPGSSIYGGLRQIMEFIAPTAMIVGIGALYFRNFIINLLLKINLISSSQKRISLLILSVILILAFLPIALKMIAMHPNQNVYYNPLIGGLKGAAEKNIYGYANTYGNAYYQGVKWLNQHAEKNARISLIWGLNQNIARSQEREDITHLGVSRSGYTQKGEYLLTTMENGNPTYGTFRYNYADKFLTPVYVGRVEGVPLVKIWKNESSHVKAGFNLKDEQNEEITVENKNGEIIIKLDDEKKLKRLEIRFFDLKCKNPLIGARALISSDGKEYSMKVDEIGDFTDDELINYNTDFAYLFAGDDAQYIKLVLPQNYPCGPSDIYFSVYTFTNLFNK